MQDKQRERDHLVQSDRHLAQARLNVQRQGQLIERLAASGHDTRDAHSLLSALIETLHIDGQSRSYYQGVLRPIWHLSRYQQIRTGKLRAVKLGRRTVLLAPDVDAWAASLPELRAGGREQASA